MEDEVSNECKEILKGYITKRFAPNPKENFIAFIKEETGVSFSKNKSYEALFHEIDEKIGKDRFFSVLGVRDIEEAEIRTHLANIFYKILGESPAYRQLTPLYAKLTGKKIKIKRTIDKKKPAYELAFNINENDFVKSWVDLLKEEILPEFVHHEDIVIGPLGWIKSINRGDKEMFELKFDEYSELVNFINSKFGEKSKDIIMKTLLSVIEEIGKNPNQFGILEKEEHLAYNCLDQIKAEEDDFVSSAKCSQLFYIYLNDNSLLDILNKLIANGTIAPKIQGLYDIYPLPSYNWIITRYGLFKQPSYFKAEPNKVFCELFQKELLQKDLEPELENYQGEYPLTLFAYCVKENPEKILDRLFGMPQLRNIATNFEIPGTKNIKNKNELAKLILLKLGFQIPSTKVVGISDYRTYLTENIVDIKRNKPVEDMMREVYVETEGLLRDLAYFYLDWYAQKFEDTEEERLDKVDRVIKELKVSNKAFQRLTFGEYIKTLRKINEMIKKDKISKGRFSATFGRAYVISEEEMNILDEISKYRTPFIHPGAGEEIPNQEKCSQIIVELQKFAEAIENKKIYPFVIQIKRRVTNEYGTPYYEVLDDKGDQWWIYQRHNYGYLLEVNKSYFMHSKTSPVAIDPIVVEKIF